MAKRKMLLEINSEIKKKLLAKKINPNDGISYLLILYYGLGASFIPPELEAQILSCGIIKRDYQKDTLIWVVSLFDEVETNFEWIADYMNLFYQVNPGRKGIKSSVLLRMKKFFANNPSIRKDDVLEATRNYLSTVVNPIHCKLSHKFIKEENDTSMLLDYVERIGLDKIIRERNNRDII